MKKENVSISGCGPAGLLGVAFVVLKLCGVITWSWFWITLPFWLPLIIVKFLEWTLQMLEAQD